MNRLHCLTGESPAPDIRLICRYDEEKPQFFQKLARLAYAWQNFEFVQGGRRIRLPGANQGAVDDAVTVQEDRPVVGEAFGFRRSQFGGKRRLQPLPPWPVSCHLRSSAQQVFDKVETDEAISPGHTNPFAHLASPANRDGYGLAHVSLKN